MDGDGTTPLMLAAGYGHPELLRLLLARGVAPNAVHPDHGTTAFHIACATNQAECAEALAWVGCDVGLKDKLGETGREAAERRGHTAVVARLRSVVGEQLRAAQAPDPAPAPVAVVVAVAGGRGSADQLVMAAEEGDGAALARLLAAGADPNASLAGQNGSGVVQTTALCTAAGYGRLEATRLLLEEGANPSLTDSNYFTPLMAAARDGHL